MICYTEGTTYDLEELGDEAWLTGCPLCGDQCWEAGSREEREQLERDLDLDNQTNYE